MPLAEGLAWVLRAFGALYIVGAIFLFRMLRFDSFLDKALREIEAANDSLAREAGEAAPVRAAEDRGRNVWLAAGGALTLAAGAAMLLASRFAVPLLALLVVQQLFYFMRQRRRELRAATPEEALDARPTAQTRSGFYYSLVLTVLAAWLGWQGALT
ncbi:MAG: hypothetical protein JNM47_13075 [Hyphomonadaceae bacterium]|nr:hypothetical protein [Hyphomonadaceae bacterium]